MNKFQTLFLSLIAVFAFALTSCETDDTPPTPIAPTVTLLSGAGYVTAADTIDVSTTFTVRLSVESGNSKLLSVNVQEDGATMDDLTRIMYDGIAASANPTLLFASDTASFTKDVTITAHSGYSETHTYTFDVRDANGQSSTVSVDIRTNDEILTTPLEGTLTGKLFANADGPNPDGGFDLSAGDAVSVNDVLADIVDEGIDNSLPNDQNWVQKFKAANGATMVAPDASFDFDAVDNKEAISLAFDGGVEITTSLTSKVQIGDVYIFSADGTYYAVKVTNLTVTAADNLDNYTLDVKY